MIRHTVTKSSFISVIGPTTKYSNKFMAFGWLKDPVFPVDDVLIPLAVSNYSGEVVNVDDSIRLELAKDGSDYRMQYNGSKSKKIQQHTGVRVNDGAWHFYGYQCSDGGYMRYYVDSIPLTAEDGFDSNGLLYSRARSTSARVGGGDVWSPYLYGPGQGVSVFHWRMKVNQNISDIWVQDLMHEDEQELPES